MPYPVGTRVKVLFHCSYYGKEGVVIEPDPKAREPKPTRVLFEDGSFTAFTFDSSLEVVHRWKQLKTKQGDT